MNKKLIIFSLFLISLMLLPTVVAQRDRDSLFGGTENRLLKSVENIIQYDINFRGDMIPAWIFVGVFMIVYSIVYVATQMIPIFKDRRNPAIMFSIGLALIALLGTNFVNLVADLVGAVSTFAVIIGFIGALFFTWTIFSSILGAGQHMRSSTWTEAHASRAEEAEAKKAAFEAQQALKITQGLDQVEGRERGTLNRLRSAIRSLREKGSQSGISRGELVQLIGNLKEELVAEKRYVQRLNTINEQLQALVKMKVSGTGREAEQMKKIQHSAENLSKAADIVDDQLRGLLQTKEGLINQLNQVVQEGRLDQADALVKEVEEVNQKIRSQDQRLRNIEIRLKSKEFSVSK